MSNISKNTKRVALLGVMLALMIVASTLEHTIPTPPMLPPNIKLGLANIIVMYVVIMIGKKEAIILAILKSLFILLIRSAAPAFMSICGGLISIFTIIILLYMFNKNISYILLSVSGAIAHNIGQLFAASLLLSANFFIYLPVMIIFGVIMGSVTGILLGVIMPVFTKIFDRHGMM